MKSVWAGCAAILLFATLGGLPPARADEEPPPMAAADALFRMGKFTEAGAIYARIVAADPDDYEATLQSVRVALLANALADAERLARKAIALSPGDDDPKVMLAEALYRRDDFAGAAAALKGVDVGTNKLIAEQYPTLNVAKLESFRGETPYQIEGDGEEIVVKFLRTDPLPLVSVRVNGGEEVTFFIDTGGSEIALDSDFAKELGLPDFGAVQGTFSGGQHASVSQSRLDSLTIGGWTVRNLPAVSLPLRQLSEGLGAKRIDGIVGTTFFYHFLATLDFPQGELVLRRKGAANRKRFAETSGDAVAVPIWMASDHFMVGWGRIETLSPSLLFVDSGLAGAGVKLAESVIKQAGIKLDEAMASSGAGAGGDLKIVPYTVNSLSFGDLKEENVPGLFDGPFPWEYTFGFHLAGMVGHDFFNPHAMTLDFETMTIFLK